MVKFKHFSQRRGEDFLDFRKRVNKLAEELNADYTEWKPDYYSATVAIIRYEKEKGGSKMKSITIIGRRWFQKGPGNTYHTATIYVDGKPVHKIPFSYGSGEIYIQNATDWLEDNGYMPDREHYPHGGGEPGWRYFREERGIEYHAEAIDVQRKKDL